MKNGVIESNAFLKSHDEWYSGFPDILASSRELVSCSDGIVVLECCL